MSPNKTAIWVAACVGCFCLAAFALHLSLPAPNIAGVTPKLQFVASNVDEIDALFIGSSRVYHGLNPRIFDETTAAAGLPTHSYNFGVDGMSAPESFYVMDRILASKPRTLRWVFVEFDDLQVTIPSDYLRTQRASYWHDWPRTWVIFRKLLELDVPERWKQKRRRLVRNFDTLAIHLGLCVRNFVSVGRGLDLAGFEAKEDDLSQNKYEPNGDGFAPAVMRMSESRAVLYEKWLADEIAKANPRPMDSYADEAYRRYGEKFRALGATPIFFVTPSSMSVIPSRFRGVPPGPVFAFNDARVYPALYRAEVRIDEGHLNAAGAEEFTKRLAHCFLEFELPRRTHTPR